MNDLEKNLREYLDTREAKITARVREYGQIAKHLDVDESAILADIRAILDGHPLPALGAE